MPNRISVATTLVVRTASVFSPRPKFEKTEVPKSSFQSLLASISLLYKVIIMFS